MNYRQILEPHLPPPLLAKALHNIAHYPLGNRISVRPTAGDILYYKFLWSRSGEGHDFWNDVWSKLENNQPLQDT